MISSWNEKKTLVLFLIFIAFRAFFSWKVPLIDDEAYHWSWTQDLMLSYFDHPAMIAWLESISTWVFGISYWGVRFPALICFSLTVLMAYRLAKDLFGEVAALVTGIVMFWSPFWGFGGYVASPEPPFMLFFTSASWVFWQGIRPDPRRWSPAKTWIWLGLLMGLGLNSKFIIALLAPGFGLYMILSAEHRKTLLTRWPWIGFLLATLLCLPIFLWNMQYDWPGFQYQFHDRHTRADFSLSRWIEWLSAQLIFYTPILYALFLATIARATESIFSSKSSPSWQSPSWKFLFCLTAPTILMFYPQPLWAEYKPHWAGGAHLLLVMGAGALWNQGFTTENRVWIKARSSIISRLFFVFLIPMNLLIYTPFLGPWMPKIYRTLKSPTQVEWNTRWDLSNEFHGWEELGLELQRQARDFHAEAGQRPFFAALRYETTAQTWWGVREKVFSLSHTKSHYTIMQQTRQDLDGLVGKNSLVVTTEKYPADPREWAAFDQCEPREFRTYRGQELARTFTIWRCVNFQGLK